MFSIENITRENIKQLKPYSSARDEFSGSANIFLDANENSYDLFGADGIAFNRYPDPHQQQLKAAIAKIRQIEASNIFLGNGSDECIDLLYRCFCEPGKDNVIICPPTYGMYEVSANINNVTVRRANLTNGFNLDVSKINALTDKNTKLLWICSPNNPTGNVQNRNDILYLLNSFEGIVVVDEAYIDFAAEPSLIALLPAHPNLVVLQTFSKAWSLAGLRLGMAFASKEIIGTLNKVKPPYNININTQEVALRSIIKANEVAEIATNIVYNRIVLSKALSEVCIVKKVYPSDANFLLVVFDAPKTIYQYLLKEGIVVRDRSDVILCEGCLRFTVGSTAENNQLIDALNAYSKKEL
jgi:histidinol-phosphate aminotransferase